MKLSDRYLGSLLGLAVGDALGTTLEFKAPGTFEPITDMAGGGPFNLKAGEWTDDTSMALCLAESLIERKEFDPVDQLERYVRWYREGHLSSNGKCFDIGNTVQSALTRFERTGEKYCGSKDEDSAGNGSIMRLAPVAMYYAENPKLGIEYCAESSRTTHQALACIEACRYLGGLIIGALNGETKDTILRDNYSPNVDYWHDKPYNSDINRIVHGSFKEKEPPDIKGSGYVVELLEAALWAFYTAKSFEEGLLKAVNLGDDADTTGSVYGQLAGAYYGIKEIPASWLDKLAKRDLIEDYAKKLI